MTIRIAVFKCGTLDHRTILGSFLTKTAPDGLVNPFELDLFNVYEDEYPANIDDYNVVWLTGSSSNVPDPEPWILKLGRLVHDIAENHTKIKLVGICFGHQLISHAVFGSKVDVNPKGLEIGPYDVFLNAVGQAYFEPEVDKLWLEMWHAYMVFSPTLISKLRGIADAGNRTRNFLVYKWGSSELTPNQGSVSRGISDFSRSPTTSAEEIVLDRDLIYAETRIFTSQGHPEYTKDLIAEFIDESEQSGDITKEQADDARRRNELNKVLDEQKMGEVIWKVMLTPLKI
ncbi:hypothetical protein CONPUDRAFT_81223 [Coniophora puteana RWD-64-598 SS2]|uniref:Uncharacterized protein n=1 Tax=Coniophora puteana (strain RWD-64-598) TaxID=741705 RepID=A0A5M3MWU5_CONPW|nr:uncharacterized protein CONPUDRAFT_81223 [Coniophora puteana RWD-64-598 SS2]EIW83175.1 hypothetical protein CONPUDRAFT_81223 [Coniophora puteana RWD-64-598 SS2]